MVAEIEELGAELQPHILPYGETLHETDIDIDQARAIQNASARIPELSAWRDCEGLPVKPIRRSSRAGTERVRSRNDVRPLPAGSR